MLSFKILSGKSAGRVISVRRFPFSVGRSQKADWVSDDAGVWENHALFSLDPASGFQIAASGDASVLVNGTPVKSARIRNGDSVRCGAMEFTCWLSAATQKRLGLMEGVTWVLVAAVWITQAVWLYQLLVSEF